MCGADPVFMTPDSVTFTHESSCNDPRVSAHLMTLTPGVHWVPHSPKTDAAVRYCKTGSIARPHGVHARAIRTGAARCIPLLGIGRSAPLARSAPACRA